MASKSQEDIRSLLKQDGLTQAELLDLHLLQLQMDGLGLGPLLPEPTRRQPYDSLYLKQKHSQEL